MLGLFTSKHMKTFPEFIIFQLLGWLNLNDFSSFALLMETYGKILLIAMPAFLVAGTI